VERPAPVCVIHGVAPPGTGLRATLRDVERSRGVPVAPGDQRVPSDLYGASPAVVRQAVHPAGPCVTGARYERPRTPTPSGRRARTCRTFPVLHSTPRSPVPGPRSFLLGLATV